MDGDGRDHDLQMAIILARHRARAAGDWGPGTANGDFPERVTRTEEWWFPLAWSKGDYGRWFEEDDPGRRLFYNTPPVPLADAKRLVSPRRVLVCATPAQLSALFPGGRPGMFMREKAHEWGVRDPMFSQCGGLVPFWRVLLDSQWYLDTNNRSLPLVIATTGQMRNHPRQGGESPNVEARLREIAGHFGIDFELLETVPE